MRGAACDSGARTGRPARQARREIDAGTARRKQVGASVISSRCTAAGMIRAALAAAA
jgi:hypothetical protein